MSASELNQSGQGANYRPDKSIKYLGRFFRVFRSSFGRVDSQAVADFE